MKSTPALLAAALVAALVSAPAAHAQDWAKARLENSPRHLEFVKIPAGPRVVTASIAFPEVKAKATAVIVIHEIFGLSDWVRGVTDQLAEAGYIAIAPDLLSGMAPKGGGSDELGVGDGVRKVIGSLPPAQITADLDAVAAYVAKLPACNGQVVVAGFCWGGSQSFRYATNNKTLSAALAFYGTGPTDAAEIARITCPVLGFYGGNDARVNSTIEKSTELMKAAGKPYEPVIYDGAGHGFMRAGEMPAPAADADEKTKTAYAANAKARVEAWQRWLALMKKL